MRGAYHWNCDYHFELRPDGKHPLPSWNYDWRAIALYSVSRFAHYLGLSSPAVILEGDGTHVGMFSSYSWTCWIMAVHDACARVGNCRFHYSGRRNETVTLLKGTV